MTKQERLDLANRLIQEIAKRGHKIFRHLDRVSRLELDDRGRVWLIDAYTQARIFTHYPGNWRGCSQGSTFRDVIRRLVRFIRTGESTLSMWWLGGSPHLWAYPAEDLPPIWEIARPMFSPQENRKLDAYLEKTSNGGKS